MKKISLFFLLLLTNSLVEAATLNFSFYQGGFGEGAYVQGEFQGYDINHDGIVSSYSGEVSSFTMDFSGNSSVPAFSSWLWGLEYSFNDKSVNICAGDCRFGFGFAYNGFGGNVNGGLVHYGFLTPGPEGEDWYWETKIYTNEPLIVTVNNIPIPASFWLFISGFAAVFRKKLTRSSEPLAGYDERNL